MKIGSTYKIVIEVNGKVLTYNGRIISEDDNFITFIDRYGVTFSYNKKNVLSLEEEKK
jgi:hypothetical protein